MVSQYLNHPLPRWLIIVNQSTPDGEILHQGENLVATSNTFYKFFFSIWDFEKAFNTCQMLAMLEVEKVIERY